MHKNFSYFGYFLFSILSIAVIAKMLNFWIVKSEGPKEPTGVCIRDESCSQGMCDPNFSQNNPNEDLYSCVCKDSQCVWETK